ncbi:MAG: Galactokinase [Phycisphaerae bacterium]|nr:Galactokinase [Phycisphaerae bacterium]
MSIEKEIACVILCAGKGTRMQSDTTHKVCFPIAGRPAICRILDTFKSVGIARVMAVVGDKAGQVMQTIAADHPAVSYVYQGDQKGTGHAAQIAADALERLGYDGLIMVTMGDKFIEPHAIRQLTEAYVRTGADLIFTVAAKADAPDAGRVILDARGEQVLASIEVRDIQRARILGGFARLAARGKAVAREQLRRVAAAEIANAAKQAQALGPKLADLLVGDGDVPASRLADLLGPDAGTFKVAGGRLTADEVERAAKFVNVSLYLGRARAMYDALGRLRPDNAQGEFYLPDVVRLLADAHDPQGQPLYKVRAHQLADHNDVLGFNNPQELLAIEDHLRRSRDRMQADERTGPVRKLGGGHLKPLKKWIELFEAFGPRLRKTLKELYGPNEAFLKQRRQEYLRVLRRYGRRFGADAEVIVVRAPGRINLMGRHVDHRGGHVNVMAINREVVMVAGPRTDDTVRMTHVQAGQFPDQEFSIGKLIGSLVWDDWLSYVNSRQVQQMVLDSRGDWSNYVKAAVVRLQQQYRDVRVLGMDVAVTGNIPMAAGLSSSSAMVVAAAESCVALNRLDVTPQQFVDLCGQGEWFVGSRGGAADHAGIRMGRRGSVARVRFFPFAVEEMYDFPAGYSLLVANSHLKATKSDAARDQFNQRVAAYEFGFMMLKDRFPRHRHLLTHLRDVNPRRLGVTVSAIYRMLTKLPMSIRPDELAKSISEEHHKDIARIRGSHRDPEFYPIREVVLYGIAECERSAMARDLLAAGDLGRFGLLMARSHDGDRVAACTVRDRRAACRDYAFDVSDTALRSLIVDLQSENPDRVLGAQLWMQPGGYRCSMPQIDQMVDLAASVPGVVGAQLSGAGLGGCVMVLAADDAVNDARRILVDGYYAPNKLDAAIEVCIPVQGSGLLEL